MCAILVWIVTYVQVIGHCATSTYTANPRGWRGGGGLCDFLQKEVRTSFVLSIQEQITVAVSRPIEHTVNKLTCGKLLLA